MVPLVVTYGCLLWLSPLVVTFGCHTFGCHTFSLVVTFGCHLWLTYQSLLFGTSVMSCPKSHSFEVACMDFLVSLHIQKTAEYFYILGSDVSNNVLYLLLSVRYNFHGKRYGKPLETLKYIKVL